MKQSAKKGLRIAGFRVTVDPMLPVVIILIGWLLSDRYFPNYTYGYIPQVNYILGGIASIMLTFSILFHELGHALAAVRARLSIDRIHLLLFGGMAELKHRPQTGFQELGIALSGPLASLILGGTIWLAMVVFSGADQLVLVLLQFVVHINFLLALFNMIPIFPLDGGRATRAILWQLIGRYHSASLSTLYLSYFLISIIFLMGVLDLFFVNSPYALLLMLLAGYLTYTVNNGRKELIHRPEFVDLLYRLENQNDMIATVHQIRGSDSRYLLRTTMPVLHDNKLVGVVSGNSVHNEMAVIPEIGLRDVIEKLTVMPALGNYIDLSDPMTYNRDLRFHTDFVPVLQKGYFLGLADANELRFWLNEKEMYDPDKPYDPTDVIPETYCE
ncbi:MAG: M50 family metallopeptidase [Bacteroidetes bacterium]|nr:M50 family metallopeptidase [Bacteroidota bacterium]